MKKLLLVLLASCATYDDPWWGDPCTPQPPFSGGFEPCKHGDDDGFCEPTDDGGACRPLCGPSNTCEGGGVARVDPTFAICYCTEP